MNLNKAANFFIVSISIVIILIYGQNLIIPFVMGLLLWFVMRQMKAVLDMVPFIKNKIPSWLKTLVSSTLILILAGILVEVLSSNINALSLSYQKYGANFDSVVQLINKKFDLNIIEDVKGKAGDFNFGALLGAIFSSLSSIIGNTFMILIYTLFVVLEEAKFRDKLKMLFPDEEHFSKLYVMLNKIERSISSYLGLKTFVSVITGTLSYIVLRIIGVDSPEFWAFLIFVLNFIPTIGSLIGTLFPAVFSLLQFGTLTPFLMILLFVGLIQVIVGNILEPRLMGSSMNISPLVTIVALSFWGVVWGVVGMILSVPITVIMIIVFSQFEQTKRIAILLSEKGIIDGK
ncbi:MAG: AI-2E family transporter [Saprospiraceae bacterium]|nr:AI-2E family transporter [Saprospiraceae bacterium]MCB9327027.1 AI-2E family transporter [Lewinellaceae bacterium]